MADGPVVMLTALNIEYEAVRERLGDLTAEYERGTRFERGVLPRTHGGVVLALTGKGNHSAAVLAERAIKRYGPVAVLFVGVAGALWDSTRLGDVVVASHVYAYHGGTSEDDGLRARPRVWESSHGIAQAAAHIARLGDWRRGLATQEGPGPQVHFGPVAAGEVVQYSRLSREALWIRHHYNDALAIEMEAAGVAQAGHLSGLPMAVVRGISDRADATKSTERDRQWQPQAAANAAAFAVQLAEELSDTDKERIMTDERDAAAAVHNTAWNSVVGIQAGHVAGSSVHMRVSSGPSKATDVAAELAALRDELALMRASGRLDDTTCEAAEAEIHAATAAVCDESREGPGKLTIALKRLRGLIGDVADLATKVAALITAVNRPS